MKSVLNLHILHALQWVVHRMHVHMSIVCYIVCVFPMLRRSSLTASNAPEHGSASQMPGDNAVSFGAICGCQS